MLNLIAAVALTAIFNNATGDDVFNSQEARISLSITDTAYLWAGYGEGRQDRLSQRIGSAQTYGGGIGIEGWGFARGFFAEIGYLDQTFDSKERVAQEVAFHSFTKDFGIPPFAENWTQVEYKHKPEGDIAVRIGYQRQFFKNLIGQISYQHYRPSEYWRITNPDFKTPGSTEPLIDGAPYWESNRRVNNSAIQIGVKFEF